METMIDNGVIIYVTLVTFAVLAYIAEKIINWFQK